MCFRITEHPVLEISNKKRMVSFQFNGKELKGYEGEPIIVALRANGVIKLKEGAKKHTPFGPFCMQGRCCSCAMTVNHKPNVMTCVTMLEEGINVKYSGDDLDTEVFKRLPAKRIDISPSGLSQNHPHCDIAIIGAGPAGMEAALMAAQSGVENVVLFDDKSYLGGQLTLQTHTFFGTEELGASIRGYEIANLMTKDLQQTKVDIRLNSTVIGLYPNNMLAFRDEDKLNFVMAKKIIVATGASEKFLPFEGNCLPGVMGAGGAQTFMNVYGVKPGKRVLIIGGGNIGVILAYQLIQAGIDVAGVVEAGPKCGAYEVHVKKTRALGVPIFTRHTIKKAHGTDHVTGATIAALDENWKEIPGSEKHFDVDTICLAVGLSPLNELLWQAGCEFDFSKELGEVPKFDKYRQTSNKDIFIAGDCAVIGEASIARLEGRIAGLKASLDLGKPHPEFNAKSDNAFKLLNSIQSGSFGHRLGTGKDKMTGSAPRPNFVPHSYSQKIGPADFKGKEKKIIIQCDQDIPCNPCEASCKLGAIVIGKELNQQPSVNQEICKGCGICVSACPGRAIKVIQYNYTDFTSTLQIPYEFYPIPNEGDSVEVFDTTGAPITTAKVLKARAPKAKTECGTITIEIEKQHVFNAAAVNVRASFEHHHNDAHLADVKSANPNLNYVCRCEEVTEQDIIDLVKQGYTSINDIKRLKRVGMGQCRGLSCTSVIETILKREIGKKPEQILNVKKNRRTIYRPPIKRITLGEAAKLKFTKEEIQLFEGIETVRTVPQEIVNTFISEDAKPSKKQKSKITIIGGGATGVFTAWWLAQLGESDVTVIEKNFLTSGQTGACLGGIRTGFNTYNKVQRAKKGMETYMKAHELIGKDVGWYQGGYTYLSFDEKHDQMFENSQKTWNDAAVKYTLTKDKNQFDQYCPGIDSNLISSVAFFPETGGANPFAAVYHFAEDAKKKGVKFLVDHEVVNIKTSNNKVESVVVHNKDKDDFFEIETEHVVNCAGTSCVKISKMVGIDLSDQIWIERHGAFITEKMPFWLDPLIVSYHPTLSGYWQQKRMEEGVSEGEIVACYSSSKIIKGFNTHSYIYFLSRMAKAMLLCQPGLADVGIIRNFAEHYVGRESGIPIIGESPVKGFWHNNAKKGHGFMCAPGDGFALAKSIIEGKTHEWITECKINEDQTLKETMK